jgi:hypothetical protein
MALIFRGKTTCVVCGEVLAEGDEIVGLPHFATAPDDRHWRYSDAGFHRDCLASLPDRPEIERRLVALRAEQDELQQRTDKALLRAWRSAVRQGDEVIPRASDWFEPFAWAGFATQGESGWRFTPFGVAAARALDNVADHH